MGKLSKTLVLILTSILAVSCLLLLIGQPTNAQSTTKPSPAEFTLKYVDNSYDVPLTYTYSTDPYSGKQVATPHGGNHVDNKTIVVTIRNQPFTSYTDAKGNTINLSYDIRYKGHFSESGWIQPFYQPIRNGEYGFTTQHHQSNSENTLIIVRSEIRVGDVVDFQVQKLEGYYTSWEPMLAIVMGRSQFTGKLSDWSSTQTITIGESFNSTPNPTNPPITTPPVTTPTPTITSPTQNMPAANTNSITLPLDTFITIIAALVIVIVVVSLLAFRRHQKTNN